MQAEAGNVDTDDAEATSGPVDKETLKAWIAYARRNVFPTLTESAKQTLEEFYVEVRDLNDGHQSDADQAVPATMRTLEAGIRLSASFARLRLSDTIDPQDTSWAVELTKEAVGLRFDPDSGEFDAARTSRGQTKSQHDRIKTVKSIIREIEHEYDAGAPVDVVVERAEEDGIDEDKTEHEISKLKQKGQVYEPRTDHLRVSE
jgi:replicative DNA helicase Mcm